MTKDEALVDQVIKDLTLCPSETWAYGEAWRCQLRPGHEDPCQTYIVSPDTGDVSGIQWDGSYIGLEDRY